MMTEDEIRDLLKRADKEKKKLNAYIRKIEKKHKLSSQREEKDPK